MIAAWMLYCALCALGLAVAAVLAERALLAGDGPVRHVWVGAVVLSLLIPAAAARWAPSPRAVNAGVTTGQDLVLDSMPAAGLAASSRASAPVRTPHHWNWRAALARTDQPLGIAWFALSVALAMYFFGGIAALAWMRRGWRSRVVLGVPVLVSERTGPALVGAVSPAIVVPEWALGLEQRQLALMLQHEQEHRRARDGQLLTVAQFAVIAMPWNIALWWQVLRLRVAVELDCDARVLRDADARSYGNLLLEVVRPRSGFGLMGATAFAERATQLERRIRVMARHRVRGSRGGRVLTACIGLATVTAAWVAPRPAVPVRAPAPHAAPLPVATTVQRAAPTTPSLPVASAPVSTSARVAPKPAANPAADSAKQTALSTPPRIDTTPPPLGGGRGSAQGLPPFPLSVTLAGGPKLVDSIFHRLFEGIALTPDQERDARNLLTALDAEQLAQTSLMVQSIQSSMPKRVAVQAQRDSALRALLSSDADRSTFDARIVAPAGTRGGRSGGPPPDSLGGGRGGGGGGGRGGGGGGRGPGRGASIAAIADATFHRLFDGIAITPDQATSALATITAAQQELQTLSPPLPPVRLAWRPGLNLVVMQPRSDSSLVALLTNDADRATLQSRISVAVPPSSAPQPQP